MIELTFEGFLDKFKKKKLDVIEDVLHFPTGEQFPKDLPITGDYVIINSEYWKEDNNIGFKHDDIFYNIIGKVTNLFDDVNMWNVKHTGKFIDIEFIINNKTITENAFSDELECWSKNKEELEMYLESKNYNL